MKKKSRDIGRREFLSRGITGIATGGLMSSILYSRSASSSESALPDQKKDLIFRTLGNTEIKIPIVSMGVMNATSPGLIEHSFKKGIRHFDTAAYYQNGNNEIMLGSALKRLNAHKDVVIGTKVFIPEGARNMSESFVKDFYIKTAEDSLKRLQTDHIDILYSHSVFNDSWLNHPGILEALQLLKKQGKTRFIGFSTHQNMTDVINNGTKLGLYDVILTMFNYAHWEDKDLLNALKNAHSKGIGLIAMKTQCPQYGADWGEVPGSSRHYYEGRIMHSAVLKWALRHPFITTAVPGFSTFQHIDDDTPVAYNLEYTNEEKKFLNDRKVRIALGYCLQCNECGGQCGRDVDVPTLMRVHMYTSCYQNYKHARQTLRNIPVSRSLKKCASCKQCSVRCKNGINVADRIEDLKTIYC